MKYTVFLRPLVQEDALSSYHWRNDPEVWKFTPFRPLAPITAEIESSWLRNVLQRKDQKRFAICLQETGRYIGNIQLINIAGGAGELHLFIGEADCRGRGLGEMATAQLLEYGFLGLGLNTITLEVDPANTAALGIYKRQGFVARGGAAKYLKMELNKKTYETHCNTLPKGGMDGLSAKVHEL